MKRRTISILSTALLLISLTACSSEKPDGSQSAQPEETTAKNVTVPMATTPLPAEIEPAGTLGDLDVQINDLEMVQDYEGKPAAIIKFSFTNNSEENASAMFALQYKAFQNGVQLETAIISDDSVFNANDLMKEIQPGASIDVGAAYKMESETAPIEFELSEAFSFASDKIGKTFEISEGGTTELSIAPGSDTAQEIGDYAVSIVSYKLGEDYEGKKAIIFEIGFTNNSDKAASYSLSVDFSAFQDGVELETAFLTGVDSASNGIREVKPGSGIAVTTAFLLTSDTSPVEIEVQPYFGRSSDTIKSEINIAG